MARLTSQFSFRTGSVVSQDLGFVAATSKKLDKAEIGNGVILMWDAGDWAAVTDPFNWSPSASCRVSHPDRRIVVVGGDEQFAVVGSGEFLEGSILSHLKPAKSGIVRSIRDIDGWGYAVGYGGLVAKRVGSTDWERLDKGLNSSAGLEAIHGFSENDIYAVGTGGQIWHFDGRTWHSVPSPTNLILSSVCCAEDGFAYAAGQEGILIRGRGDAWNAISHKATAAHIWHLHWFRDRLFASTYSALYELTSDGFQAVEMKSKQPNSTYHLSSCDDILWSIGEGNVVSYNGTKWSEISTSA